MALRVAGPQSGSAGVFSSVTDSGLTAGRVVIVGTAGLLEDDAELLYNKTTNILTSGAFTSTVAIGTAPLVVDSTTVVANLNASALGGATFAAPAAIGTGTPAAITGTTIIANGTGAATVAFSCGTGNSTTAGMNVVVGAISSYCGIYPQNISPSSSNYTFLFRQDGSQTFVNASSNVMLAIGGTSVLTVGSGSVAVTGTLGSSLAGVAAVYTNATTTTGANVGTLTNCPHTGNPALYWEVSINGTTYAVPCFALS